MACKFITSGTIANKSTTLIEKTRARAEVKVNISAVSTSKILPSSDLDRNRK